MYSPDDTIVAIATPPGRGGIGVVRVAGPEAVRVSAALLDRREPLEPRHATLTRVVDAAPPGGARTVDEVVATWFAAPDTYTGDDVVEISAHGNPVILIRIVEGAMRAGARLAEPGEFTLRAYLNGRIDLVQAEAVADLIDAVTPLQARAAMDQLEGTLTVAIRSVDARLFDLAARLEASLDFPDEGFHFVTRDEGREEIGSLAAELERLAAQGRSGRVIREGRLVAIVGRPNAGKSSLFNALAGAARAIVTAVPGTTRDVLTERVDVGGVPVTFVDTAGLRTARDPIEVEGVARARQAQEIAALTLLVLDRSAAITEDDRQALEQTRGSRLIVANKIDLPAAWSERELDPADGPIVPVSALTGAGLDALRDAILGALVDRESLRDTPAISNARHLALVDDAAGALARAGAALESGATEELVLADLAAARGALEEITGRRTTDDVLQHIFSRFCVGK